MEYEKFVDWIAGNAPQDVQEFVTGQKNTEQLLRQLIARMLPKKVDKPIVFLASLLDALASELRKLDGDAFSLLHGISAPPVKVEETPSKPLQVHGQVSQPDAASSFLQDSKELKLVDMNGENVCKVTVKPRDTLVELMRSVTMTTEIPLIEQQYSMTVGAESKVLIDMLEPLGSLLAPLDKVAEPSLLLVRRSAEHAQWMAQVFEGDYNALQDAPREAKADPAIALAYLQMGNLTEEGLNNLCTEHAKDAENIQRYATDDSLACEEISSGARFQGLPDELGRNLDFLLGAMRCKQESDYGSYSFHAHHFLLDSAAPDVRRDRQVLLAAVANSKDASPERISKFLGADLDSPPDIDFKFALELVQQGGYGTLAALPEKFRTNSDIAMAALSKDVQSLLALHNRSDTVPRELMLAAIKKKPEILPQFGTAATEDREFVLAAVELNGLMLGEASEELRADRHVVMQAVKQNRKAINFIHVGDNPMPWLKDKELWHSVVTQKGFVLWSRAGAEALEMLVATDEPSELLNMDALNPKELTLVHVDMSKAPDCEPESTECAGEPRRRDRLEPLIKRQAGFGRLRSFDW